jgi:hypothetical protein
MRCTWVGVQGAWTLQLAEVRAVLARLVGDAALAAATVGRIQ